MGLAYNASLLRRKDVVGLRRTSSNGAGFTLLETLVALAVLSLTLAVLLPIFSNAFKNEDRLIDERTAIALAETKIAGLGTDSSLIDGITEGKFDNGFGWKLDIASYQASDAGTQRYIKRETLTVRWPKPDGTHSLVVSTLRFGRKR